MNNSYSREPPAIPEEQLRTCLRDQYGLPVTALEFLPRGKDYHAGVYRVAVQQGTRYLLKVKSGPLYEPACLIPSYLRNQGVPAVVAPVPTKTDVLWVKVADWAVMLYPYIDGDTSLTEMSREQWKETGTIFKHIHAVPAPPQPLPSLRRETFEPTEYVRWIHTFETRHLNSRPAESEPARSLRASWARYRSTIHRMVNVLEKLGPVLQVRTFPYVICHADLHPANLIRDGTGHVFVIDWDDVRLAPKERDFIFISGPQANGFWQGYGNAQVDWIALVYFRWERVVQDLIYYTSQVCFRDDLAEQTKAQLAEFFVVNLSAGGSNINAAYAAEAHLPRELSIDAALI